MLPLITSMLFSPTAMTLLGVGVRLWVGDYCSVVRNVLIALHYIFIDNIIGRVQKINFNENNNNYRLILNRV